MKIDHIFKVIEKRIQSNYHQQKDYYDIKKKTSISTATCEKN